MLFHKHGGQNDAGGQNPREGFHKLGMLEALAFLHGNVNPDRVIHMNTRKQVRRCVGTVNHLAQVDKDIVPGEIVGTQIMAVGIDCRDNQKNGHSRGEEDTQPVEIIVVVKKEVDGATGNVRKPQDVRHNKKFTKRNEIIQWHMYNVKMGGHRTLNVFEPKQINQNIGDHNGNAVLLPEHSSVIFEFHCLLILISISSIDANYSTTFLGLQFHFMFLNLFYENLKNWTVFLPGNWRFVALTFVFPLV